jgi:hypothetical protein
MKLSMLAILILSTNAPAQTVPASDAEASWGETKNGFASRLSVVTDKPTLGQPLRLRFEVKNTGMEPASYDAQQAHLNGSITVKDTDGAIVPYIGGSYQTSGSATSLKSGESKTVFADLDVAVQYLIVKPGQYAIQSRSRGNIPASNLLAVTVRPGDLSDFGKLFEALHRVTPKDWRIANYSGSIVFLSSPTRLKSDSTSISLMLSKAPTGGPKPQTGQPSPVNLGETTLGQAWLIAQDKAAAERWPDYEKVIGEQVKVFKK